MASSVGVAKLLRCWMPPQESNHLGEARFNEGHQPFLLKKWFNQIKSNQIKIKSNHINKYSKYNQNQSKSNQIINKSNRVNQSKSIKMNQSVSQSINQSIKVTLHPIETKKLTSHCTPIIVDAIATDMGCSTSGKRMDRSDWERFRNDAYSIASWWFQPSWKILICQNGNLPQVGVNIKKIETTTQKTFLNSVCSPPFFSKNVDL